MKDNEILFGIDNEEEKVVKESPKRSPFAIWSVGGEEFRMKLSTANVCNLERKFGRNLTLIITDDDIPPLSTMLTVIQGALSDYNHGITYVQVQKMYDTWVDEGHNQMDLMTEVILPIFKVSGFFTNEMWESLEAETSR